MTSNPKAIQNGQRSSPNSSHFGAEKSYAEVNAAKSLPKVRAAAENLLEHSRLPLAWHDQRIALGFA
jgi:hypothetical protein